MKKHIKMIVSIVIGLIIVLFVSSCVFLNAPRFGRLPQGERLERIKKSPQYRDGEFRNQTPTVLMTSEEGRFKAMWKFLFGKKNGLYPDEPVPAIRTNLKNWPAFVNRLVWFGHSSYLIQIDGKRVLVDPVFYAASPVSFVNKPFKGTDIYKPEDMPDIDYLVISHDHWDHLDYQTVTALKERVGKVICPLGVGEHFERWGFSKESLVELDWHETSALDSAFVVHCLPARHFSGRGLKSNQSLWASFMLDTPSMRIYIGGDSGYGPHFKEIGKQYPDIDLAILENGQYNEDWRYIHMLPDSLGRAARELNASSLLTVHHSKFAMARHRWDEPLENELRAAEQDSLPLVVLKIGEVFKLPTKG